MNSELPPEPGATTGSTDQVTEVSADDAAVKSAEEVATATGTLKTAQRAKAKRKPVITTIEELLTFAYESNARLLEFSRDALKKLEVTDDGFAAQRELVESLAAKDPTLATPYKLLQYTARQGVQLKRAEDEDLARALNRIVDLAVVALEQNPVFRDSKDELRDHPRDPQLSTAHLRDEARRIDPDKLGLAPEHFKATDRRRLAKNAIACCGILHALDGEWSLDQFIDAAYSSLWKYEAPEAIGLERAVGRIGASRDHDVLGIVSANFLDRIVRLDRQVAQHERDAESAGNRVTKLSGELAAATEREQVALARAEAFSADVVRLQKELAAERDNRVVDKSHMADDYETLRTRIIRRLGGEVDLLTDGLHALRNGAPNVAEEFLDRSLLALSREVEQLKDAAGGLV